MKQLFTLILAFTLSVSIVNAQVITIAEARAMDLGDTVHISGTITNGAELGVIRYFEDGTAGIPAYDFDFGDETIRHDSITLKGVLVDYNGLLELTPVTEYTIHGQALNEVIPTLVTPDEIGEDTEGQLIQINDVIFADGGGNFGGGSTYSFTSNGETGIIYLSSSHSLVGEIIPVGAVTLIGLSSQYSFTGFGGYQIIPRDADDIINDSDINIVSPIEQSDLSTSGFTLSWFTDVESSTGVYYGTDEHANIEDMSVEFMEESVTDHSISLAGLESGEIYFARAFSVLGNDTAISNMNAFATVSLSDGEIVVLFNFPVNTAVANSEDNHAIYTTAIDDSVAAWIDKSMISLDIAMYNLNRPVIEEAINDAYSRGVQIRYIAEGGNANLGLDYLNINIPVLERENATSSGMHNKFMIIDADSTENAWIMGGSTNFTSNMIDDPNNAIFIQDQSLARGFEVEFNEMWGSEGPDHDADASRFGEEKLNNTPHTFIVNGDEVELYFSPSDGVTSVIIENIEAASEKVYFSTLVFTRDDISDAVIAANDDFFVDVRGMIEQINVTGSEFETLVNGGVNVKSYQDLPGQLHHKLAMFDPNNPDEDPVVLTGSHNWSSSAENSNDENILVIHNADIANQYYQEFTARWNEITVGIDKFGKELHFSVFPNPAKNKISIQSSDFEGQYQLLLNDVSGKTISIIENEIQVGEQYQMDISSLNNGIYYLTIRTETGVKTLKFIKN